MESGQQTQKARAGDLDALRAGLHTMWSAVAPGWERNADFIDSRTADLTATMLDAVALEPGDRVLELACGPGGLGLAAAARVAPGGAVVLSDVTDRPPSSAP